MSLKDNDEDAVLILLRRIRSQLDQLTDEITDLLEVEHLRDGKNKTALIKYDRETDGKQ